MSTHAILLFRGAEGLFGVYKHMDGYPSGVAEQLKNALECAWPLPRFESNEFAAAYVAANKNYAERMFLKAVRENDEKTIADWRQRIINPNQWATGGNVRLMRHVDIEQFHAHWKYVIFMRAGNLMVEVYKDRDAEWIKKFVGTFNEFEIYAQTHGSN